MNIKLNKKAFKRRLKMARAEYGLSQKKLSEYVDIHQKVISNYETGHSMPTLETLFKIAKILRKDIGWFFKNIEEYEE